MAQAKLPKKLPIKTSAGVGLSMLDRAVKESFASRCAVAQLREIEDHFRRDGEIRCIYCRSRRPSRWDHLHPVSRGGDTVPGNLVPACSSCDDSKQDSELSEWVERNSIHSPSIREAERITREISEYRMRFPYEPKEFELKLSNVQLVAYRRFREELAALREHLQEAGFLKANGEA